MTLSSGTKLGPYEIQSPLGAGGMGEVYRARDTRLGREIALKILPESFARDGDRLHRFEQEARAVAALNHPNILAIFDTGQHSGAPFLVSELLEGDTLRAVLDRGALPQRRAIDYGVQIVHRLAAAHEKAIVHRDLKPENIFVSKDGRIKILDFGLAKLAQKATATGAQSDGITLTSSHTAAGLVMGTASYMAPEQVRGETADPRTDIFAFGAVLYEMLSGVRAFRRDTPAETMTAVLKDDPAEFTGPVHPVSPSLDRIVRRCLEKAPEQRFQSAKDLSFALSALSGTDSSSLARVAPARRKLPIALWAGIALALLSVAAITWFTARPPAHAVRVQFAIPVPGEVSHMAISADGTMLAFVSPEETSGLPMIYAQRVGSSGAALLPGTEGASYPFLSPDGANVAFFANGKLQRMGVAGGAPQILANVLAARGGSWGSRDVIIYAPAAGSVVWRINGDGSGAAPLTDGIRAKNDQTHRWPMFLPDGDHFMFWAGDFSQSKDDRVSGIYLSSISDKKDRRLVTLCHSSFAYGFHSLFYIDDQNRLVSVDFNSSTAKLSGVTRAIARTVGFSPSTFWGAFTAAEDGTLIYNTSSGLGFLSALTWVDRTGKEHPRLGDAGVLANPSLSPDGSRVAVDISDQKANNIDIWIESAKTASTARLTFDPREEVTPVWSRDGSTLAFRVAGDGPRLYMKLATGLEREKLIYAAPSMDDIIPNSWSPGNQEILFTHMSRARSHLELVPVAGGSPAPFLSGPGNQTNGMISPDGKWVAYSSDESGNWEVYVTIFPGAAGKWQVSRGGGTEPRWRGDSREIFYLGSKGMLNAVPVNGSGAFSTAPAVPLFQIRGRAPISSSDVFSYDVTSDGKRFLVNRYVKPDRVTPLTIVLHAGAGAKDR